MKSALFTVLSLLLLSVSAQEPPPASEMPPAPAGEMEITSDTPSFCASSLDVIMAEIRALWAEDRLNVTINCLAFGRERMLESGIVSTVRPGGRLLTRYTLRCRGNALTATQSAQQPLPTDIVDLPYRACVECEDVAVAADICQRRKSTCFVCFLSSLDILHLSFLLVILLETIGAWYGGIIYLCTHTLMDIYDN